MVQNILIVVIVYIALVLFNLKLHDWNYSIKL